MLMLLPLLPGRVPYRVCAVPAAQMLPQALGQRVPGERDLLHEVVLRASHEDLLLQGLPHGA